jgi:quercetin dioxygenase-like cupin family protein
MIAADPSAAAAMARLFLVVAAVLALFAVTAMASDADNINDYCPTDLKSMLTINGLVCKAPKDVTVNDFMFSGFQMAANVSPGGIVITPGFAGVNFPGLNTLGLSLARIDYAKGGLVPAHTHPRATEVLYVLSGEVFMGFVDTAGKLFAATLKAGEVFVFPRGLVHFQLETGKGSAASLSVLGAQNPGVQLIAPSLFGSTPTIPNEVLTKGFGITDKEVNVIKMNF